MMLSNGIFEEQVCKTFELLSVKLLWKRCLELAEEQNSRRTKVVGITEVFVVVLNATGK